MAKKQRTIKISSEALQVLEEIGLDPQSIYRATVRNHIDKLINLLLNIVPEKSEINLRRLMKEEVFHFYQSIRSQDHNYARNYFRSLETQTEPKHKRCNHRGAAIKYRFKNRKTRRAVIDGIKLRRAWERKAKAAKA